MNRRSLILAVPLALAALLALFHPGRAKRPGEPFGGLNPAVPITPTIVVILTDDQAHHTVDLMPKTNALVGDAGVRFTRNFATTPLCCPSRASILTGQHTHNHRVLTNVPPYGGAPVFKDSSTVATWLRTAGFRTAFIGKYLNYYAALAPYVPPGWSNWYAFESPGYYNFKLVEKRRRVFYGEGADNYSTNVLARKAVQVIETTAPTQPLFLVFAPFAPHEPATPAPEDVATAQTLPAWRSANYGEADVSDKPAWVRALNPWGARRRNAVDAIYRSQVESLQAVDRAVEEIVFALQRMGRLSTAAIIFTSDNGYALGAHRWKDKHCVYEECARTPLMIRAPGVAPRVDASLTLNIDLAATIAELAGVAPPPTSDGRSLVPLLFNSQAAWRDAVLLEILYAPLSQRVSAVRTERYLYAEYRNGDRELYDLLADPWQLQNDLRDPAAAATVSQLRTRLAQLKAE